MKTIHKCLVQSDEEAHQICSQLKWIMTLQHPFVLRTNGILQGICMHPTSE